MAYLSWCIFIRIRNIICIISMEENDYVIHVTMQIIDNLFEIIKSANMLITQLQKKFD